MGFAAVNTGNNLLFLIVSGLLAFMSVTGFAGMQNLKTLTPEIIPPDEVFAGVRAPFRIRIHNHKGYMPSFLIRVRCLDSPDATFPVVPRSGLAEATVGLTLPVRGRVDIGQIIVSSPFPVNFFNRYWRFTLPTTCLVFPSLLPAPATAADDDARQQGYTAHQARGVDGELERIVPYSGHEPLRMVHWKLSARGNDLLVKEFGGQTAPPKIIDLETLPGQTLEERISHAAWLVQRWRRERPLGLSLPGRVIPAKTGYRHTVHLLTELALYGS